CGCSAPRSVPSAAHDVLVVRTPRDLDRLAGLISSYRAVQLHLPGLSGPHAAALQAQIERDYLACGCAQGARALRWAALLGVLGAVPAWAMGQLHGRELWALAFAVALLSLAAKLGAVSAARWRLARTLRHLRATLPR
ncbi:MAG: hypothetical protein KGQ77_10035, partial [Betaproteobacteria bacterium]|nr:hypothetical protein [Betaproteobacteria bacterium]